MESVAPNTTVMLLGVLEVVEVVDDVLELVVDEAIEVVVLVVVFVGARKSAAAATAAIMIIIITTTAATTVEMDF